MLKAEEQNKRYRESVRKTRYSKLFKREYAMIYVVLNGKKEFVGKSYSLEDTMRLKMLVRNKLA